jgi:cysteine desulfurase/selenocysteine lyase
MVEASLFPGVSAGVYLNTATMALGNVSAAEAVAAAYESWVAGTFSWVEAEQVAEDLRSRIAGLVGAASADIAFVTGASGGTGTVAAQLRDGGGTANVVVPACDFSSNLLAWTQLADRGYEVRLVQDIGGVLAPESFAEAVDQSTAVVATSLVQSSSGFRVDLSALKTIAADADAWLVVDASQALGSLEIDVEGVAALTSCSHKWLLGVRGMGYLYVQPELRSSFTPIVPGWKATVTPAEGFYGPELDLSPNASKLDVSTPWFDPMANIEGLRIIEHHGIQSIERHNLSLVDGLEESGISIPFDRANRSPIVSIKADDPETTIKRLNESNITASVSSGRVRASMHLYNTAEDLALLSKALR